MDQSSSSHQTSDGGTPHLRATSESSTLARGVPAVHFHFRHKVAYSIIIIEEGLIFVIALDLYFICRYMVCKLEYSHPEGQEDARASLGGRCYNR
jgi:hypothetical protein